MATPEAAGAVRAAAANHLQRSLLLTLAVSAITFASGRTNVIQGLVHLVLFAGYLLLIFEG